MRLEQYWGTGSKTGVFQKTWNDWGCGSNGSAPAIASMRLWVLPQYRGKKKKKKGTKDMKWAVSVINATEKLRTAESGPTGLGNTELQVMFPVK
jgi:hypothetical protein